MANEFFTILTATGRSKLARAVVENTPLALTHMAVGSGNNDAYYTPGEDQTSLKHEVWRGPLNNLSVSPENPNWIVAECVIPDNVGGFYIREMGLFDTAGTLIAVGRFPESYKPTMVDGSNKQLYVRMILEVSNTASVTLLVDQSIALATHQYVDNKISSELQKLDRKESVRVATTSPITLSDLQTIDGISLVSGDRVLVKNQGSAKDNGIYIASSDAWARSADANTSSKVTPDLSVPVEEGIENADSVWMLVTDGPITLGSTALEFDWVGKRNLVTQKALQTQAHTAFTTTGSSPNFTFNISPALGTYIAGHRFRVRFHSSGSGSDTISINSLGNIGLKQYNSNGQKIPAIIMAEQLADIEYDGTDFIVLNPIPYNHPGEVVFFARNTPPIGFLKANGAAISRTTYAALFAVVGTTFGIGDGATTFNLPDLRGEFIRGWDDGRGVDTQRAFGSSQVDLFKAHKHRFINEYGTAAERFIAFSEYNSEGVDVSLLSGTRSHSYIVMEGTGGSETRPRNIALLPCIKY